MKPQIEPAPPGSPHAATVRGHASLWGVPDAGGDVVERGAFAASLKRLAARTEPPRMLWQHDPAEPIGVWDRAREDERGLWVEGRLLLDVGRAREAAALVAAGAIDGLSIGYRAVRATRDATGRRRLHEVDLWEVSLVTFPMLREARLAPAHLDAKGAPALLHDLSASLAAARARLRA